MTTTPTTRVMRLEYQSTGHVDEFITIIDSLGREWNPLKHPRDRLGRFIRTFSFVSFNVPGAAPGSPDQYAGRVSGVDKDGSVLVKLTAVPSSAPTVDGETLKVGDYYRIKQDQVEVKTVKARIRGLNEKIRGGRDGNTHKGRLTDNEAGGVRNGVKTLAKHNLNDLSRKLDQAVALAVADYKIDTDRDVETVQQAKNRAIDLFREVGEAVADERAKGYGDGDDYAEIKKNLSGSERRRLTELDKVIASTFTARHALGDRTLELENDQGQVKAKQGQVRVGLIKSELKKDESGGATVWDGTGPSLTKATLTGVETVTARDTVRVDQSAGALPELAAAGFQRLRSGLNRAAGFRQAKQVAPSDRFHVDKDGNEVAVGSIVEVAASGRTRRAYTGLVTRINTDENGKKTVFVRDFVRNDADDVATDPRYAKGYKTFQVTSKAITLADQNDNNELYKQLAAAGVFGNFVDAFTEEMKGQRRLAGPGAKRISPTSGLLGDSVPVQERVRRDINGEGIKIGDHVADPNGAIGVAVYIEPHSDTVRIEYPDKQNYARIASKMLTRIHGATSDVFTQDGISAGNNYVPTREEAATAARNIGATDVADAIESGGDSIAIQAAMRSDANFQAQLVKTTELFERRDQALAAGQEPDTSDQIALRFWNQMAAASAEQFRDGTITEHTLPTPPETTGTETPRDPANPTRTVSPAGTAADRPGGTPPAPSAPPAPPADTTPEPTVPAPAAPAPAAPEPDDEDDTAVPTPTAAPAMADDSMASKVFSDLSTLVDQTKRLPGTTITQRQQLDKWMGELTEAVEEADAQRFIDSVAGMSRAVHSRPNRNLVGTPLSDVLRGSKSRGTPLADFLQKQLDAGTDLFSGAPATTTARPLPTTGTPDGIDPVADTHDQSLADNLLADNGSVIFLDGEGDVTDGFYVLDPETVQDFDDMPDAAAIKTFFDDVAYDGGNAVSLWQDDNGVFHLALAAHSLDEDEIKQIAEDSGAMQYVDVATGAVYNIVGAATDDTAAPESVEDTRSEARGTRTSGTGNASVSTTAKQKSVLDRVAELPDAPTDVIDKVRNGEEIEGADASRLADFIAGADAGAFDKPADKGLAQQLADKLARATGEVGARPYPSQATALSKTNQVALHLDSLSQNDDIRNLTEIARQAVRSGDFARAADAFRDAADGFEALDIQLRSNLDPVAIAREHAARLDAAPSTSGPDAEGVEPPTGPAPGAPSAPDVPEEPEAPAGPPAGDPEVMRAAIRDSVTANDALYFRSGQIPSGETVDVGDTTADVLQTFDITEDASSTFTAAGINPTSFSEIERSYTNSSATVAAADAIYDTGVVPQGVANSVNSDQINARPQEYRFVVSDDGSSGVVFTDQPNGASGNIVRLYAPDEASLHATLAVAVSQGANRMLLSADDADMFDIVAAHGFVPTTRVPGGTDMPNGAVSSDHFWFVRNPAQAVETVDVTNVPTAMLGQAGTSISDVASRWARLNAALPEVDEIVARDPASMQRYADKITDVMGTLDQYGVTNFGNNALEDAIGAVRANAPISPEQRDEAERLRGVLSQITDTDTAYSKRLSTAITSYDAAIGASNWQAARDAIQRAQFVENNPDGVGGVRPDRSSEVTPAIVTQVDAAARTLNYNERGATQNAAWNDWLDNNEKPQVAPVEDVNDLVGQGWIQLYRTVKSSHGITAPEIIDNIREADQYFVGDGLYGNGLYFSSDLTGSLAYGKNTRITLNPNDDSSTYVRAVISPDARWISSSQVYTLAKSNPALRGLDIGIVASIFGYDVIVVGNFGGSGDVYYNVINRGVLVMDDTDLTPPIDPAQAAQDWATKQAQQAQAPAAPGTPGAPGGAPAGGGGAATP